MSAPTVADVIQGLEAKELTPDVHRFSCTGCDGVFYSTSRVVGEMWFRNHVCRLSRGAGS